MHKFKKIYLDMDGVICDFTKRYKELYGYVPDRHIDTKEFHENFDDFIKNRNFETLDLMPDATVLLHYLRGVRIPIEMLTSTGSKRDQKEVARQKQIWLDKHRIDYPANFVPGKSLKKTFADEESIIIDDTDSVIRDWRKAGGIGIWHKDANSTILQLGSVLTLTK